MDISVYLFTGFLESGKTTFIQETLESDSFNDDERTLVLICEEGIEELDPDRFVSKNVFVEYLDSPDKISERRLQQITDMYSAQNVIIEYNGMWNLTDLINNTPESWVLCQNMLFADSSTFLTFNSNMRNLVADKMKLCDTVVFNRFDKSMDKMEFHKIVRTFNRRADILYEYEIGRVEVDDIQDPLPYDMESDVITVEDDDYAVWYRDVNEETPNYENKIVNIKGRILNEGNLPEGCFVLGRHVMTCCIEDIEFCGVVCRMKGQDADAVINSFAHGEWVYISAVINNEVHRTYGNEPGPVLTVKEIYKTAPPVEEVAVFY